MIEAKCAASLVLADPCIAPPLLRKKKKAIIGVNA
jgi:hypothetical protein